MSYIYLQERGEESSAQNFSDIEQFVLLRLKNTQEKSCSSDSETESCLGSQSGTTSVHSMQRLGEESLILSPEDFLAKTFPQLERELESRANAQGFGERWPGWWARYDQDSSSWKTLQCSLLGDLEEFLETWPNWGIMLDGAFWGLTTSVRHIEERESGYWPTPNTLEGLKPKTLESIQEYNQKARPGRSYCNMNLREIVVYGKQPISGITIYGTPTATMKERSEKFLEGAKRIPNPAEVARKESGIPGQLNPDWVEWLMGWPIGWTKIEPIEIDWRDWAIDPADIGEVPRVLQSIQNRVHRLKAIGNGQVPLAAEVI